MHTYREQINEIDEQLLQLFEQRMKVSLDIAEWKKKEGRPVPDLQREREKINEVRDRLPEELKDYGTSLYGLLMDLSKSYQRSHTSEQGKTSAGIGDALKKTPQVFPEDAAVACQGVEGAYSQIACARIFRHPNVLYFDTFPAVFSAIEKGLCRYGMLPLENSTAGSVNQVYDLMMQHHFSIVRSVRIKVDHHLLARKGVALSDIRTIYSHEQAISQCAGFLSTLQGVNVVPCENTAAAARMVAESEREDIAALSSRSCMDLYDLACLKADVQDSANNYTRFICISKEPEIYPGADRTSMMLVLPHTPGSLYRTLSRFYAHGININKLESRPMPERNFEFMFYFDIEGSVYAPRFTRLIDDLESSCESFVYLGSYTEIF
ncbi:MAG: bifunctional chorismate mutase/prephenate dehydratase [Lachnospiraceae bacterium]|nr:bifunctional chorismate mutase/prephenate dehydratase [Lachnospiraceae bacterium]